MAADDRSIVEQPTPGAEIVAQGGTLQKIETKYATAISVQKPRDLKQVREDCLVEAALAGESCYYGWGAGKDRVEGPSITAAMIMLRNWGNMAVEMDEVHETATAYIMKAYVIDIEKGVTLSRQFRQSKKWTVYGKMDAERKDDVRFQIGQSKTQRNVILRILPGWLTDAVIEKAKEGVRIRIENYIKKNSLEGAREKVVAALSRYSVDVERIEYKIGRKYGEWGVEELVLLQGDIKALSDKVDSATVVFPAIPEEEPDKSKNGLSVDSAKLGDPADHQSVKKDESGSVETDQEFTERHRMIQVLLSMSADEKYNKAPGLKARFEILGTTAVDMSEAELEKEIKNINDVQVKHEKGMKKKAKDGDQGKLM